MSLFIASMRDFGGNPCWQPAQSKSLTAAKSEATRLEGDIAIVGIKRIISPQPVGAMWEYYEVDAVAERKNNKWKKVQA
jgi:hypothetical protein